MSTLRDSPQADQPSDDRAKLEALKRGLRARGLTILSNEQVAALARACGEDPVELGLLKAGEATSDVDVSFLDLVAGRKRIPEPEPRPEDK